MLPATKTLLRQLSAWARKTESVQCVLLVGSYARGNETPTSDIDIMILTDEPSILLEHHNWLNKFGKPNKIELEHWGVVDSLRVQYSWGGEVEFTIGPLEWANLPLDWGTESVLAGGAKIILDDKLETLKRAIEATKPASN